MKNMLRTHAHKTVLTRDHVIWAYRLFLDREPENVVVVENWLKGAASTTELRQEFMRSTEFIQLNSAMSAYSSESKPAIALLQGNIRLFVDLADYEIGVQIIRGAYEKNEYRFICELVKPGQRVLDIGANIGFYSLVCAHVVGPTGHVHAYEPLPQNLNLFEQSIRENQFEGRITLTRSAVGKDKDTANLVWLPVRRDNPNSGGAFLQAPGQPIPPGHKVESVPVVSIDSQSLPAPIDFIKIDIEGAEFLAFEGARDTLLRDHPTILSEINPVQLRKVSGVSPSELLEYMNSLGFLCRVLEQTPNDVPIRSLPESGPTVSVVFSVD
ncbi:MAG: FkbM family methyltransferase [bacterium]